MSGLNDIKTHYLSFDGDEDEFVKFIKSKHAATLNKAYGEAVENVAKNKLFKDIELAVVLMHQNCIKPELDKWKKGDNSIIRIPISITTDDNALEQQKIIFNAYDLVQSNGIGPAVSENEKKIRPRPSKAPSPLFCKYNENTWNVKQTPDASKKSLFYLCIWLVEQWFPSFCSGAAKLPAEIIAAKKTVRSSKHCKMIKHSEIQMEEGYVDNPGLYAKTYVQESSGALAVEILVKDGSSYVTAEVNGEPLTYMNCHKILTRLSVYKKAKFSITGLVHSTHGWSMPCVLKQAVIIPRLRSFLESKEQFTSDLTSDDEEAEEELDADIDRLIGNTAS